MTNTTHGAEDGSIRRTTCWARRPTPFYDANVMMDLDGLLAIEAAQVARVRVVERLAAAVADVGRLTVGMLADGMRQLAFVSMASS